MHHIHRYLWENWKRTHYSNPGKIQYSLVEGISKLIKRFDPILFLQMIKAVKVKDHLCRARSCHSLIKGVQTGSVGGNCTP